MDRTVIDSNMRFNNSNSVRLIMDSLRSIDPTELDYISPSSPGPAHYDLEEVRYWGYTLLRFIVNGWFVRACFALVIF